jgi:hypothetical protein
MPIVSSVVKVDRRPKDGSGMVIADHLWDDGSFETAVFEAHSSEDLNARLAVQVQQKESARLVAEQRKAEAEKEATAFAKLDAYAKAVPDADLEAAGLTKEEIAIVKGTQAADEIAEVIVP